MIKQKVHHIIHEKVLSEENQHQEFYHQHQLLEELKNDFIVIYMYIFF